MHPHRAVHREVVHNLAFALVAASDAPVLLIDSSFQVVAASTSFCKAFHIEPANVAGCQVADLGDGEWDVPQLHSLLKATIAGHAEIESYEMALERQGQPARQLVLKAHKLDYDDANHLRIILTVADVTDARLSKKIQESLLHDKAVLHQELQHRVANSLQIIASVLMQSAKNVQSEEVRNHLHDAHSRVMSVAALEQHLVTCRLGEIELQRYLKDLCSSIGASMIRNHEHLTLEVHADESTTTPDISTSLGLIVTELVINALKHAFPDHRAGKITVGYKADGPAWDLSVTDNGVGMAKTPKTDKGGLGTSIVEALAEKLEAEVLITDATPGTKVSIIHSKDKQVRHAAI